MTLTRNLIDREERAVASLLTRFKNLVALSVSPIAEHATKELAASQTFQMEVESAALVCLLHCLSRTFGLVL